MERVFSKKTKASKKDQASPAPKTNSAPASKSNAAPGMPLYLQRSASSPGQESASPQASSMKQEAVDSIRGGGHPLPKTEQTRFKEMLGADFSGVRVHNDNKAAEAAKNIGARAFTLGSNIVFGASQYAPDTQSGRQLLAHELTHVAQQSRGGTASREVSSPTDSSEVEASNVARQVDNPRSPIVLPAASPGAAIQRQLAPTSAASESTATTPSTETTTPSPPQQAPTPATADPRQAGPPIIWGMDTNTRNIYMSVTIPGRSLVDVATYVYGSAEAAAGLRSANGGLPDFLPPGTTLRGTSDTLTPAAQQSLNNALAQGLIMRTEGVPTETSGQTMVYRFTAQGQDFTLTEGQFQGLLQGLSVWITRKARFLRDSARDGRSVQRDHVQNTNSVVRGISNLIAGQNVPNEMMWDIPENAANQIIENLSGRELNGELISRNARALQIAAEAVDHAFATWHNYIEGTISGGERAVHALEITRNVSFGIAAGIAGAVAAPAIFAAAGGAIAAGTISTGTATALSIGGAAVAGGTLRGGLEVAFGGAQAERRSAGERFVSGFGQGALQGGLGGAGALAAPLISGGVTTGLTNIAVRGGMTRAAAQQMLTGTGGRMAVNAATGTIIGAPAGAVSSAVENASALASGRMSGGQYARQIGSGFLWGGALGGAFSFLPVRGLYRSGGVPFRPGAQIVTPRWMLAGPYSPLQADWNPPPGFNNLAFDQLPPLMEGYVWTRINNVWEPMSISGPFRDPVTLRWYDNPTSTNANYNLLSGQQLLGSRAFSRPQGGGYAGMPADTPVVGMPRSTRRDFPMGINDFIEQGGTRRYIRGHNIDFRDTTDRTATIPDSNMDPLNFTPEPDWWGGLNGRMRLVERINNAGGGGYRQMNYYRPNPPRTQNGTPIPDGVYFVETNAAGTPVRAWRIDFTTPPASPLNTAAAVDAAYGIPLNQLPASLRVGNPTTVVGAGAAGAEVNRPRQ